MSVERKKAAKHGTRSKYVAGCRCEPCVLSNRDYQRDWMWRHYSRTHKGYVRLDGTVRPG